MNGRRTRAVAGNPLEGRANLRLQGGKSDFSDSSPPEFDQESPLEGEVGRPHFSGQPTKTSSKNLLEVPRRGSNGLPGAFQTGQSAGSKDNGREKTEKTKGVSFEVEEDSFSDAGSHVSEPEKVVPSSPRKDQELRKDHEADRSSKPERKSSPADSPESKASLRVKLRAEVEEYARKLRKTASKYPSGTKESSTKGWFGPQLKERYFDIVIVDPAKEKTDKATRLGWWENEEEAKNEEALGDIPIASITEVIYKQDIEKGLQVNIVTNTKDKKGEKINLLMRFSTAKEAKSWSTDLKTFQVTFKRWSALFSDEERSRENSAKPHMSMCASGSTFTAQSTNSSGSRRNR